VAYARPPFGGGGGGSGRSAIEEDLGMWETVRLQCDVMER